MFFMIKQFIKAYEEKVVFFKDTVIVIIAWIGSIALIIGSLAAIMWAISVFFPYAITIKKVIAISIFFFIVVDLRAGQKGEFND